MEKIQRLSADQRDNLVAYLDGELDDKSAQDIEQILSRNPVARSDVEMMTRTWELLDELPRPSATQQFTERTLATLKSTEAREPLVEQKWYDKARKGAIAAGWLAGVALSAVVGFSITNQLVPSESRVLIEELPLVENVTLYAEVDDIEFLRELHRSGLFQSSPAKNP